MARIRSVKPELRTDLTVAEWPREVRYAWVLLLGYLDDHGRGRDDCRLVVADLFPLDRDVTERKIDGWLARMAADGGPLCRYEVDGRGYLHAVKWTNHQRISHPTDSRLPPCPFHDPAESGAADSGIAPDSIPNGDGAAPERFRPSRTPAEQGAGNKGAGNKGAGARPPAASPDGFAEFWLAYPRKEDRGSAEKAYRKALKTTDSPTLVAAARRYAQARQGQDRTYTKLPATWLNAQSWANEDPRQLVPGRDYPSHLPPPVNETAVRVNW